MAELALPGTSFSNAQSSRSMPSSMAQARAILAAERGRPADVICALEPLLTIEPRTALDEPGFWPWPDLYANALIDVGRLGEADTFLAPHERRAAERDRPSAIAKLARARGRLAAANGRVDDASAAFDHALEQTERVSIPYERALTELSYGELLRRHKQRRAASARLTAARERFEALGARPARERCERELRACGLKPAKRNDLDPRQLTAQERAVTRLVTRGMSNREIASEMIVSVRTVDFHLRNVYAKLDIRSRAQLMIYAHERVGDE